MPELVLKPTIKTFTVDAPADKPQTYEARGRFGPGEMRVEVGFTNEFTDKNENKSREFGLELSDEVEVRVWDSTAELRYLVLPERPAGTEGLSEDALAALVTRDSMVGVGRVVPSREGAKG